jgi:hypothetical protein
MTFNPQWILDPLATYAITGTGIAALLFLWFGAKLEARQCRQDVKAIKEFTDGALRDLASKVDELAARPTPGPIQEYPVVTQSLNLTRRARALHMRCRGETPHTIAAALGISRGEVDLLFKLDQITQQPRG